MTALDAAQSYKSQLVNSLATAKRRLTPSDYEIMAGGLKSEIARLDEDIATLRLGAFMGSTDEPIFPRIIEFAANAVMRLRPTPQTFMIHQDFPDVTTVDNFVLTATGRPAYVIPRTPTVAMNAALQVSTCTF